MKEHIYKTPKGDIHYWTNDIIQGRDNLIFLPGLSADHTLFDKQIEAFEGAANVLVWDAPAHAASRPFQMDFTLSDKATWLHGILAAEGIESPVLVGQSMGGYLSQAYMQLYPGEVRAFISIDSAPLQLKYYPKWELSMLRHVEPIYRAYPWKLMIRHGAMGTAQSPYGRELMAGMIRSYSSDPAYYAKLVGHGYMMLADAISADLPYAIDCPALLICGEKDMAGFTKSYNKRWAADARLPIEWIPDAGHNSNTDHPEMVSALIEKML